MHENNLPASGYKSFQKHPLLRGASGSSSSILYVILRASHSLVIGVSTAVKSALYMGIVSQSLLHVHTNVNAVYEEHNKTSSKSSV